MFQIRIEVEEAKREAARLKAIKEAVEELEAAKQREEEAGQTRHWEPLRTQRMKIEKKLKELQATGPIQSPPRRPKPKEGVFIVPELRGGGTSHDIHTKFKSKIQRSADYTLIKLARATRLAFKVGISREASQYLTHEVDMRRRQRIAEARAERVFADLARGVKFEDPLEAGKRKRKQTPSEPIIKEYLKIRTIVDFLMARREVLDVFLLPVVGVSGLVVREVDEGRYERIGMFSQAADVEMGKLPWPKEPGEFLLV